MLVMWFNPPRVSAAYAAGLRSIIFRLTAFIRPYQQVSRHARQSRKNA